MKPAALKLIWTSAAFAATGALLWAACSLYLQARDSDVGTVCLTNVKDLTTASLLYSIDHDGRLMGRDSWMDEALPFQSDRTLKRCPSQGPESIGESLVFGYAFNSKLSGNNMQSVTNLAKTALVYDSINYAKNASDPAASLPNPPRLHGGSRANFVGYTDGNVRALRPRE